MKKFIKDHLDFILFIGAMIVLLLIGLYISQYTFASFTPGRECKKENAECNINQSNKSCCSGLTCIPFNRESGNGKCVLIAEPTPTPTVKPACTPTPTGEEVTPTVTPSEESSPTPTEEISTIPTVTPTPTSTPRTGDTDRGQTSAVQAPGASTCTIPFSAPVLTTFTAGASGSVTFGWLESDTTIDKFSIIYGYSPESLTMGEDNIPSESRQITLNLLKPGQNVFAQIYAYKGGCAEISNILDPQVR